MDWATAVTSRQLVSFSYDGHPRVVIPAAFGRHASTGNLVLRAYQVAGTSAEGSLPGWRLFRVEEARSILTLDEFAGDPPSYRRGDRQIFPIYAQL